MNIRSRPDSGEILTKIQSFFDEKPFVFFGTGTSCAVDRKFGMRGLLSHLEKSKSWKKDLTELERKEWDFVINNVSEGQNFEDAMAAIKETNLLVRIINQTARYVARQDERYRMKILNGSTVWPAIKLFQGLMRTLTDEAPILHVATSNYDMLAEYAFFNAGIEYLTGFHGQNIRKYDWQKASQSLTALAPVKARRRALILAKKESKHIRLYKVHGSLNTFLLNNQVVEVDGWTEKDTRRIMVIPGKKKYSLLHEYRYQLLSEFDNAVRESFRFLFLGFGFNDSHLINQTFRKKLIDDKCLTLIITRCPNKKMIELAEASESVWIIYKRGYNGAYVYNSKYPRWRSLDQPLWEFDTFSTRILGGSNEAI